MIDLDKVKPMIALPFHPSNVYTIDDLNENAGDILEKVEKEASGQIENPNLTLSLRIKSAADVSVSIMASLPDAREVHRTTS